MSLPASCLVGKTSGTNFRRDLKTACILLMLVDLSSFDLGFRNVMAGTTLHLDCAADTQAFTRLAAPAVVTQKPPREVCDMQK